VLADDDSDGMPNWNDTTPYSVDTDADDDGIDDSFDPYPNDSSNFSSVNNLNWGSNVLGDNDQDGVPNWNDADPLDSDGDGLSDGVDPFVSDFTNYSTINGSYWWYSSALGDIDNDGMLNWQDAWPYDANNGYNPDRDWDGIANASDPAPDDYSNYSYSNWQYWYSSALGDNDADGVNNFQDAWPYDANNGNSPPQDSDGDGIPDSSDPAPSDWSNYSYSNWQYWYSSALGDNDADGVNNWQDAWPYDANNGYYPPQDSDGDGIPDNSDPAPWDSSNYSYSNNTYWYGGALSDNDSDGVNNFQDAWPYDSNNGQEQDSDGDGIYNSGDPAPWDSSNYSPHNWQHWYSGSSGKLVRRRRDDGRRVG
jgi:hypothetical protein